MPEYWDGEVPWVSPKDFGELYLFDTKDHLTTDGIAQSASKIVVEDTVLVVVRSGVLAHSLPVTIAGCEMAINQDLKALVCKEGLLPLFLAVYLRTFAERILPIITKHGVTVQSINTPEFRALPIPLLDIFKQEKIAKIYTDAIEIRNKSLKKADALLVSIDDYLLSELGIVFPSEPENIIINRMFRTKVRDVAGARFDPFYNQTRFPKLMHALEQSPFKTVTLGTLSPRLAGGATPKRGNTDLYSEDGIKFLRIMNVCKNRFELNKIKYIQGHVHEGELRRSQLEADDVLMTITGRVGTCVVVTPEVLPANINQHIVRLQISKTIALPEYVSFFFNSKLGFELSNRSVTGGTRIALDYGSVRSLPILLPDLEKQRQIVNEAIRLQSEAYGLRAKADAELENAKAEIEVILLGGNNGNSFYGGI